MSSMLLISAFVNAIIYGTFSILLDSLNKKELEIEEAFDLANTAMSNLNIELFLSDQVRGYLQRTKQLQQSQNELVSFRDGLSPSLKELFRLRVFESVYQHVELLIQMQLEQINGKFSNSALESRQVVVEAG